MPPVFKARAYIYILPSALVSPLVCIKNHNSQRQVFTTFYGIISRYFGFFPINLKGCRYNMQSYSLARIWPNIFILQHLNKSPNEQSKLFIKRKGNDTQTDMLQSGLCSAICVQRFDDSLNPAIHITYRSLLRSSSMHEPRDPPLKVVM